jgi:hypothetical protein
MSMPYSTRRRSVVNNTLPAKETIAALLDTDILKQMTEKILIVVFLCYHAHHQLESIPEESRSTARRDVAVNKLYVI